jgi:g-D-glutamyl-meso-diaminopimelate peptidase
MDRIVHVSGWYDHEQLESDLLQLQEQFPCISVESIGTSVTGKDIKAVTIGHGSKKIHYNAAIHANEWVSAALLMTFLEDYAESVSSNTLLSECSGHELLQASTLYAVPMVNPDGVELVLKGADVFPHRRDQLIEWNAGQWDFAQWKANIHGVDLNDQFPAFWEVEHSRRAEAGAGPRDYGGVAPLTEPESIALATYTESHRFDLVMALHTQGREIYWNYRDYEPPDSEHIAELFADQSGYRAIKLYDSDAGYKDWFIQTFRKPGFTVEIGYGVNPLPITQFQAYYQEVLPILEKGLYVLGQK